MTAGFGDSGGAGVGLQKVAALRRLVRDGLHGATLATRNTRHFEDLPSVVDPWG